MRQLVKRLLRRREEELVEPALMILVYFACCSTPARCDWFTVYCWREVKVRREVKIPAGTILFHLQFTFKCTYVTLLNPTSWLLCGWLLPYNFI